jgi:hypothetical protein
MPTIRTSTESAASKDGILYVITIPTEGEPEVAGDTAYADIVAETMKLATLTTEPKVKVILAKACVEVHKHPDKMIGVVYEQGAAVVKSLQRMLRKLARSTANKATHHTTNPKSAATIAHEGADGRGHDGEVSDGGYQPTGRGLV